MRRRWWIAMLLVIPLLAAAPPASAGILTSGSYTYMLEGRSVELPVDMLALRGEYLVPTDLLALFGLTPQITVDGIRLERGPVSILAGLGSETALVDGERRVLKVPPMRVSDRLFIPAELLPDLGITLEVEGKFALLTDHAVHKAPDKAPEEPFAERWAKRTWKGHVREESLVGFAEITALTPDLLHDPALPLPWGVRQRLLSLAGERTLLLVTLTNRSIQAMTLDPKRLMLVDAQGEQYDYLGLEIPVDGSLSSPLAPGAARTAVLAYPQVGSAEITLYHDGSRAVLGTVSVE